MSIFDILAEQRIAEAFRRGEFEHLPGAGRPLVFDDDQIGRASCRERVFLTV